MKKILFTSLIVFLSTIKMVKGDEIKISHQQTSYTLNDFNKPTEINAIECDSDSDCLSNSCVDGVCDFYFLCPENEKCVSLQSDAWKTYDSIDDDNDIHPENYKPILKSCYKEELHTNFLAKLLSPTCSTEKCEKNSDCLFGTCFNSTCITETPIYKCKSQDLVCKKANYIKCTLNEECYSSHCISGFCIENAYPSLKSNVIKSFIIALAIRLVRTLVKLFYSGFKKKRADSKTNIFDEDGKKNKKNKKDKKDKMEKKNE